MNIGAKYLHYSTIKQKKYNVQIMKSRINEFKRSIVEASYLSSEGHVPSAFSILDILIVLYDKVLHINPKKLNDQNRDRFVLSKGHGSLGLYVVLADKKFFPKKQLKLFAQVEGILGGHPDSQKVPGVEVSTGSLGHGFPMAVGMALGLKIAKNTARVFSIIGDGESNEGSIWEATLLASHHKLDNLVCIIDHNHSTDRALSMGNMVKKFEAFDWKAVSIPGHNHKETLAIIAETIKGFGSSAMAGNPAWHHRSPTKEEFEQILKELK